MADTFDYSQLLSNLGNFDYSKLAATFSPTYQPLVEMFGSYDAVPKTLLSVINQDFQSNPNATPDQVKSAIAQYQANPTSLYQKAFDIYGFNYGYGTALGNQIGSDAGGASSLQELQNLTKEALNAGLSKDQINQFAQSGIDRGTNEVNWIYNPGESGWGASLINDVGSAITSNPVSTLLFPLAGAQLAGADLLGSAGSAVSSAATPTSETAINDYLASLPSGYGGVDASTAAVQSANAAEAAGTGFGINPSSTGQWGLSTTPTATGINTSALNGMEYLGGTGSLPVGTAGLTADQLATATQLGQVGTNAASGLGYLGGAESLPAGTAGITGVTSSFMPSLSNLTDAQKLASTLKTLTGSTSQIAQGLNPQTSKVGQGYSEPNPFYFPKETSVLSDNKQLSPTYLGQLAQLLRG